MLRDSEGGVGTLDGGAIASSPVPLRDVSSGSSCAADDVVDVTEVGLVMAQVGPSTGEVVAPVGREPVFDPAKVAVEGGASVAQVGDAEGEGIIGPYRSQGHVRPVVSDRVVELDGAGAAPAVFSIPGSPLGDGGLESVDLVVCEIDGISREIEPAPGVSDRLVRSGDAFSSITP